MDGKSRESGCGFVRFDALTAKYKQAKNEQGLEETLAAELTAQGWQVTRQAYCRPMNEGWRRIDIYAVGYVDGYTSSKAPVAIGIELKDEDGARHFRTAYAQIRRYREASVWCTPEGEMLTPPSWLAYTSRYLLGGAKRGTTPDFLVERFMWDCGASTLRRNWDGNLEMTMRVPHFRKGPKHPILTTADCTFQLTYWKTDRKVGEQ